MSVALNALRRRYDRISIATIHVAFALSLLLHALLLSGWLPKVTLRPSEKLGEGKSGGSLAVRLVPAPGAVPAPPPAPSLPAPSAPAPGALAPSAASPKAQRRAASAERLLALERPSQSRTAPSTEAPPAPPSADADFAAFIEARRRARESASAPPPAPPVETAQERDNRIAAINLGLNRTPSFGDEKKHGGGIFQIARLGFNDAEFFFYGWNKAIRRNSRQMIEVQRGANPSTEIAVVRRMIVIIREHEQGDFFWESRRLGRDVWLSARAADNAGLEEFMMREFFPGARPR